MRPRNARRQASWLEPQTLSNPDSAARKVRGNTASDVSQVRFVRRKWWPNQLAPLSAPQRSCRIFSAKAAESISLPCAFR